jgi:hypothetical protein
MKRELKKSAVRMAASNVKNGTAAAETANKKPAAVQPAPLVITGMEDACQLWREQVMPAPWYREDARLCVVAFIDRKGRCAGLEIVSAGSAGRLQVTASELFRRALLADAAGMVLMAMEGRDGSLRYTDDELWLQLEAAGRQVGVTVHDLIVFPPGDPKLPRSARQGVMDTKRPARPELQTDPLNLSGALLQKAAQYVAEGLPVALAWTVAGYHALSAEALPGIVRQYERWLPHELRAAMMRRYC